MGKMIGYVEGADIYLIISLILFIAVFVIVTLYMTVMTKEQSDAMSNLPLSNSNLEDYEN